MRSILYEYVLFFTVCSYALRVWKWSHSLVLHHSSSYPIVYTSDKKTKQNRKKYFRNSNQNRKALKTKRKVDPTQTWRLKRKKNDQQIFETRLRIEKQSKPSEILVVALTPTSRGKKWKTDSRSSNQNRDQSKLRETVATTINSTCKNNEEKNRKSIEKWIFESRTRIGKQSKLSEIVAAPLTSILKKKTKTKSSDVFKLESESTTCQNETR